jgi:hypothetical protein
MAVADYFFRRAFIICDLEYDHANLMPLMLPDAAVIDVDKVIH